MNLLDAHCHFDLMKDPAAVAAKTDAEGIFAIGVTNAPSVFHYTQHLCREFKNLRAALGLHPELVASHHGELPRFLEFLPSTHFVGEVGLDFVTSDASLRELQRKVFRSILDACALSGDKVLTVHSRRAATAVLEEVGRDFPGTVILHWFSGTQKELRRAIDSGCMFSINLAMLTSKSGQELLGSMPRERVLTETDGPFAKITGRPAVPSDIRQTVRALSRFWNCSEGEATATITNNLPAAIRLRENRS